MIFSIHSVNNITEKSDNKFTRISFRADKDLTIYLILRYPSKIQTHTNYPIKKSIESRKHPPIILKQKSRIMIFFTIFAGRIYRLPDLIGYLK